MAVTEHDVVVIGAGHNGLVAAGYLARAGLDVIVVEAAPFIGGMTRSARLPGAPDHVISPCAVEFFFLHQTTVVSDLGLEAAGFRTIEADPPYVHLDPDGPSIAFFRDPRRTADDIARLSRADAAAYLQLAETLVPIADLALPFLMANPTRPPRRALSAAMGAVARHPMTPLRAAGLFRRSPAETLTERFEHPVVRNALAMLLAAAGPITERATAGGFLFVGFIHRFGLRRPVGGMGTLPEALTTRLAAWGGSVRTSAPAAEILLSGGRANGVRLDSGETIIARRAVVSTVDPQRLVADLLPAGALPRRITRRVTGIPANGAGLGTLKVDLALSRQVRPTRHGQWRTDRLDLRHPTTVLGSLDSLIRAERLAPSGRWDPDLPLWALPVSGLDPTIAPAGQDVVYLWSGWAPLRPSEGEADFAAKGADALLARAATVYDGFAGAELARKVATSAEYEREYRVTNGCIVHIDLVPSRSGPLRPARGLGGYRTPVAGLYLSGAGTHPGGGVSGLPGKLAAERVLHSNRDRLDP